MTPLPKMRPRDVEMSPEAIDLRLRQVSDVTQLCVSLGTAKRLGTVKEIRERDRAAELAKQETSAGQLISTQAEAGSRPKNKTPGG